MKSLSLAGIAGLATLGAQAQLAPSLQLQQANDAVVVTASRTLTPLATVRDAVVISREQIEAAGPISLAELLQREAGMEIRSTGGPGQPQSLLIRGASAQETLVLVDGMRVGSATVGTTSIEHIPLELIERIEVVKGPLSSLYGAEAIGGVVQIFTRGKSVPHLFASVAYGTDSDSRVSAGLVTEDGGFKVAMSAGFRDVDAPSATNPRAFGYNPDRDPYRNAFGNIRLSQKMWQGETIELEAFGTRSRTHFDAGPGDDVNQQSVGGVRLASSNEFAPWWLSRFVVGQGRDRIDTSGAFPGFLETRQDQGSWVNELSIPTGKIVVGAETVRQKVLSDAGQPFSRTHRDTNSAFAGVNEAYGGHRFEASVRRDDEEQFGARNTGSASYGLDYPGWLRLSATFARGFRPPTFYDLYGPSFPGAAPNPDLRPERSDSRSFTVKSDPRTAVQWRATYFDHRLEDLIVFSLEQGTVLNVARARVRGVELEAKGAWRETRWRVALTAQRPRDEVTGLTLQGRAGRFGTAEAAHDWGRWTGSVAVIASGERFASPSEAPASRLAPYAVVDARVSYRFARFWSADLVAANIADKRYENVVGYDAPRRSVLLRVNFEAF